MFYLNTDLEAVTVLYFLTLSDMQYVFKIIYKEYIKIIWKYKIIVLSTT